MASKVPIEIFNIGRTTVDREEVQRWLDFLGVKEFSVPEDGAITNPALLIALAAKRCYKSFEPGLNPNVTKVRSDYAEYLDNVLKQAHGCYDAETEVLTACGWKSWPEVSKNDLLATLDHDGALVYEKPVAVKSFDYTGRMYRVETRGVDLLVTPNHMMYVCPTTTREDRQRKAYKLIKAEDLDTLSHAYTKVADAWSPREPYPYTPHLLRLLGFCIGDGYYSGSGRGLTVHFHLRRPRKVAWLKAVVKALADQQEGQWGLQHYGNYSYAVTIHPSFKDTLSRMYTADGDKCIPQHILMTANRAALEELLEGLMQVGGNASETGDSHDTTSPVLAGQIQQLCLHVGVAADVNYTYGPEELPTAYGDRPLTRLSILSRGLKPEINKYTGQLGRSYWVEKWTGEVFCAQMSDATQHVLYVRRNGQPVWCGNSVLEHSVYTFAIENISRVFSGEMNRHRAGWAISEGSMRYIRFSDAVPYWEPTSIKGPDVLGHEEDLALHEMNYEALYDAVTRVSNQAEQRLILSTVEEKKHATRILLARSFEGQRNWYKLLEAIWADVLAPTSTFAGKKEITSMMRRGIGMGCATGGVWSGNIRALRWVMTARNEPGAEEEILHVFSRIAKMMKDREPLMFGDFYQDENGYWRPKYRKV